MNEFARILLGCYSDSEDKILVPRSRSERQTEEEMPPSLKVTKLKIETKLSELWLVIIKHVIFMVWKITLNFNNVVWFNSALYLTSALWICIEEDLSFKSWNTYIEFRCCFLIKTQGESFNKLCIEFKKVTSYPE